MTESIKKTTMLTMGAIIAIALACVAIMPGCAPASDGGEEGATATEQTQPASYSMASLDALMGELSSATTLEEANELIGVSGEYVDEHVNAYDSSVTYKWDLDDNVSVQGSYVTYAPGSGEDYATYETKYVIAEVKDKVDFPDHDVLKKRLNSKEDLTYEELVGMLGGNPGLKEEVSTLGGVHYIWYGKDGGYLFSWVNAEGVCTTTSAYY